MHRVKDISLAGSFAGEAEWAAMLRPVTARYAAEAAGRDCRGKVIAASSHILPDAADVYLPFVKAGARVRLRACNANSTDDAVAAHLAAQGMEIFAWSGMSEADMADSLAFVMEPEADILCDMGGELIAAYTRAGRTVAGALEATTTGLHVIAEAGPPPFPVFDWNGIPLKDGLHNRYHVGMEVWPVFSQVTSLDIVGRRVLVIGFGPVGQGVAERAKALGAVVSVVERDPVRALEAMHFGLPAVALEDGLRSADIVVTATGRPGVLGPEHFPLLRERAIVFNVGHGNREIDVPWLDAHAAPRPVRPLIDAYTVEGRTLYLLNQGNLLNLAPNTSSFGANLFDPFSAIMIAGMAWLLDGGAAGQGPGVHRFPEALEREIAARTLPNR